MNDENPAPNQTPESTNSDPKIEAAQTGNAEPETQPASEGELQQVQTQLSGYEKATLRWTIVVVVINLITCIFIGLQWHEMNSGSADTHTLAVAAKTQSDNTSHMVEAANTQATKMTDMSVAADKIRQAAEGLVKQEARIAEDSERAIAVSNEQAKANIEALRTEQRAWVSATVSTYPTNGVPAVDSDVIIRTTFTNIGRTPANGVDTCIFSTVRKKGEQPSSFDCPVATHGSAFVGPLGTIFTDVQLGHMDQGTHNQIMSDDLRIWVFGFVAYDDVFSRHHRTEFCNYLLSGGGYAACNEHNKMD